MLFPNASIPLIAAGLIVGAIGIIVERSKSGGPSFLGLALFLLGIGTVVVGLEPNILYWVGINPHSGIFGRIFDR